MTEFQSLRKFYLDQCPLVSSDMLLDNATCRQKSPCAACIIVVPKGKVTSCIISLGSKYLYPTLSVLAYAVNPIFGFAVLAIGLSSNPKTTRATVKPCAAYLQYIQPIDQLGKSELTLQKLKGFTAHFNLSGEVMESVKIGIKGCESNLGVTTKFDFGVGIKKETKETWKTTLPAGSYAVFQTVILYAYRIDPDAVVADLGVPSQEVKAFVRDRLRNLTLYDGIGSFSKYLYFFVPVHRNDPFTKPWTDSLYETIEQDALIEYLMGDGFPRWESPAQ